VNRRHFLGALAAMPLAHPSTGGAAPLVPSAVDPGEVRRLAREMAGHACKAPDEALPDALTSIDCDRYRAIGFLPSRSLWRDEGLPFEVQFLHRGFFYKNRVDIHVVENGRASAVPDRPETGDVVVNLLARR